jgi:hypothetical protein
MYRKFVHEKMPRCFDVVMADTCCNLCSHPFGYFPTFYLLKGAVEGRPLDVTIDKYKNELWDNCKALWLLWVPAQLVNFSMVPHHLRIPFGKHLAPVLLLAHACLR